MATYLPVLPGSVNAIPDDSAVSDLPCGQVDYLSHQWREEDVWRSWRSMTRLKNEIANGVRLENASWRTWWKQRNGLKTVTPETLNWLKDSDVTWLYGPLHTADPAPRPSPNVTATLDLPSSPSPTFDATTATVRKPILKHRSIGELLTSDFPLSPLLSPPDSEEEGSPQIMSDGDPSSPRKPTRPPLIHTKSDTHITRWGMNRVFRRDSPPRVELLESSLLQSESPPSSVPPGQKRKHISFNTVVEQCIAIDKPKKRRPNLNPRFDDACPLDDDGYDEDSEDGIMDETDEMLFDDDHHKHHLDSPPHTPYPPVSHPHHSPPAHTVSPPSSSTSEEDDDDEVLHMRVRHNAPAPSPTHSSSSTSSSSSHSRHPKTRTASAARCGRGSNGFIMRSPSTDKELVTIALIAPTILKRLDDDDEHSPYPLSHTPLPVFPHPTRDSHNKDWSLYGAHDSPVELVCMPPSYIYSSKESEDTIEQDIQTITCEAQPNDQATQIPVTQQEHQTDLAGPSNLLGTGADLACTPPRVEGASTGMVEQNPEVVVSLPDGHPDISRSRPCSSSRSRSRSRTPSPNTITAPTNPVLSSSATVVPGANSAAQGTGNSLLSPSDPSSLRGRSASSPSLSSQAQVEQPRGRSIARTSSFSDRESLHAGSPLGSLSPDGSVGLGIGSVSVRDRERDARVEKEGKRSAERGRDRLVRRPGTHSGSGSSSSLSPDDPHAAARVIVVAPLPDPSPVPEVRRKCSFGSSSSGSSTITVVPTARLPPRLVVDPKPITQTSYTEAPSASIPISPSYAQEEQESISRQPTPANSPVLPMLSPPFASKSSPQVIRHERKPSSGSSRSPTRDDGDVQHDTLVGRAVEIMSNAGAFLGSLWHSGTPAGIPTS